MCQNDFFQEINRLKHIFLVSLTDNNDCDLHIQICGSKIRPSTEEDNQEFINKYPQAKNIIAESCIIEEDRSTIYDIYFEGYLSYNSKYESFINRYDDEIVEKGNIFRIYKTSKFLEYLRVATFILDYFPYKHYQIICAWQIIDIVSDKPPIIKKIQFGGN